MKWRILWILLIVAGGVGIWFALQGSPGPDHTRLQGDWNYSVGGRNNLGVIRVEGEVWTYRSGGPGGKSYRITLRPESSPKEIDLALLGPDGQPVAFTHGSGRGGEVKLLGIYEISGDTVRVKLSPEKRPANWNDDEAQELVLTR